MEEELIDKVQRDGKRKVALELLAIRLATYSEHKDDCESGLKDDTGRIKGCTCGLTILIEQVDSL